MTTIAPARLFLLLIMLGTLWLAACQPVLADAPTPAPPTPTPSRSPTASSTPTDAPTPSPIPPTATPEPTPTPVIGKDLMWAGEPAPLGLLGEEESLLGHTDIYASALFKGFEEREVEFLGETVKVHLITLDFGVDPHGEPVVGSFFVSGEGEMEWDVFVTDTYGRTLPRDPVKPPSRTHAYQITFQEFKSLLRMDKQYSIDLTFNLDLNISLEDCAAQPGCMLMQELVNHLDYNRAIAERLRTGTADAPEHEFGWIPGIFYLMSLPRFCGHD